MAAAVRFDSSCVIRDYVRLSQVLQFVIAGRFSS
jgi:hypothetical protein